MSDDEKKPEAKLLDAVLDGTPTEDAPAPHEKGGPGNAPPRPPAPRFNDPDIEAKLNTSSRSELEYQLRHHLAMAMANHAQMNHLQATLSNMVSYIGAAMSRFGRGMLGPDDKLLKCVLELPKAQLSETGAAVDPSLPTVYQIRGERGPTCAVIVLEKMTPQGRGSAARDDHPVSAQEFDPQDRTGLFSTGVVPLADQPDIFATSQFTPNAEETGP